MKKCCIFFYQAAFGEHADLLNPKVEDCNDEFEQASSPDSHQMALGSSSVDYSKERFDAVEEYKYR